jgi:hypothetical protein
MAGMMVTGPSTWYSGTNTPYNSQKYGNDWDASQNPHFEYDAAQGLYVPKKVDQPSWKVSPDGKIYQSYGTESAGTTHGWNDTGRSIFNNIAGGGSGGGGGAMGALGAMAGGGTAGPALINYENDESADRAARTDAKERAALRLQSSVKALDSGMSARGIRGSGLQRKGLGTLLAASQSDEANAELGRLNQNQGRRWDVTNRNQDAQNRHYSEQNQMAMWGADRADRLASTQQQMALALAQFGMRY